MFAPLGSFAPNSVTQMEESNDRSQNYLLNGQSASGRRLFTAVCCILSFAAILLHRYSEGSFKHLVQSIVGHKYEANIS